MRQCSMPTPLRARGGYGGSAALADSLPVRRLGKIGKEIEEAQLEVSKLERVCPEP